jgi:hypothetical protein
MVEVCDGSEAIVTFGFVFHSSSSESLEHAESNETLAIAMSVRM